MWHLMNLCRVDVSPAASRSRIAIICDDMNLAVGPASLVKDLLILNRYERPQVWVQLLHSTIFQTVSCDDYTIRSASNP
jgi:hypothetical protein